MVACASGTAALFALARLHGFLAGRPLRWVVSAFTFCCQRQGPLADAVVIDCDADGAVDIDALAALDPDAFDGVIATPLFGMPAGMPTLEAWCRKRGKRLLLDAATCAGTRDGGRPIGAVGDGVAISLHHTKPLGFGEGGYAMVPVGHEDALRSIVNFGRYAGIDTGRWSMNAKMSDVAAAFALDRLRAVDTVRRVHVTAFERVARLGEAMGFTPLLRPAPDSLPSCVPLLAPRPFSPPQSAVLPWMRYYRPLDAHARHAADLYSRIVCLPCHAGVARVPDAAFTDLLSGAAAA